MAEQAENRVAPGTHMQKRLESRHTRAVERVRQGDIEGALFTLQEIRVHIDNLRASIDDDGKTLLVEIV